MGKVRAISPEEQELKAKEAEKKEAERLARIEEAKAAGQRKKESEPKETEEETTEPKLEAQEEVEAVEAPKKAKKTSKYAAKQKSKTRERSENYQKAAQMVDKSKLYSTKEALALLDKAHLAKFDETVELHINTVTAGLSGQVTLPHGTGKAVRVAILNPSKDAAGAEALLKDIEAGKISFDVLVATPDAMPKLARVARVLGPKGLMPNPKTGTVSTNPEAVAKSYEGGQMHYKTEAKTPVMHLAVGKLSFGAEKLSQNIESMLKAVKMENIKNVTVKSTMSPGIRLLVK